MGGFKPVQAKQHPIQAQYQHKQSASLFGQYYPFNDYLFNLIVIYLTIIHLMIIHSILPAQLFNF